MKAAIYRYIFLKIQSGEWGLLKRIPSEHQLAVKFSATRSLVRKILANLCAFQLLDNVTFPGYFVNSHYRGGLLKNLKNPKIKSIKHEWLMTSPFRERDIEIFKKIAKNNDFSSHYFAKVLRVTYYDDERNVSYVLDTILNHAILKIFPSEFLDFQTYKLFAANGQPVVDNEQIVMQLDDVKDVFKGYKLTRDQFLCTYLSHFNFDGELLALSRIVFFDADAELETTNLTLAL